MNPLAQLLAVSNVPEEVCISDPPDPSELCGPALSGLNTIFSNVVEVALWFGGIILFIMLLVGGFKYITSGGDPKSLEGAKRTLTFAIIGFVLLASAFLILRFIAYFTGANVTEFNIIQ